MRCFCLSAATADCASQTNTSTVDRLRRQVVHLEQRGHKLKEEKEQLREIYEKHCYQQVSLVQDLVAKMKTLRGASQTDGERLQVLADELLEQAKVELSLALLTKLTL